MTDVQCTESCTGVRGWGWTPAPGLTSSASTPTSSPPSSAPPPSSTGPPPSGAANTPSTVQGEMIEFFANGLTDFSWILLTHATRRKIQQLVTRLRHINILTITSLRQNNKVTPFWVNLSGACLMSNVRQICYHVWISVKFVFSRSKLFGKHQVAVAATMNTQ